MHSEIRAIIFDLGGVLIDWNPRYVYRQIFKTDEEVEWFLQNVTTLDWNEKQDEGYPLHKATEELIARHPEWETEIKAYYGRWLEMLGEAIHETVEIFRKLKTTGKYKLYALTNWSAELFPHAREKFEFLKWFDGIVVSGEEKMRKPSAKFYRVLLDRYGLAPGQTIFIDDSLRNVEAAEKLGIKALVFKGPENLMQQLKEFGIEIQN